MPEFSRWPAPAKINLMLHITGRRPDGYHDLQTVFQLLDWGDEIDIAVTDDGRIVREEGAEGVVPEQDLAVRAAHLLQRHSHCDGGAVLRIHKFIPMGSGLGGGSSDAATVLVALNRLWGCGLVEDELAALGARLGADVPVFVRGRSAWAEGVGERLEPLALGERHYVLVFPGISIATADLFSAPELRRDAPRLAPEHWASAWGENDFEPVVRNRYPAMAEIMDDLAREGRPVLTGTGSCIFLAVDDNLSAVSVTGRLECRYNVRSVTGIDFSPVLHLGGVGD